jgi:hypothetical protein
VILDDPAALLKLPVDLLACFLFGRHGCALFAGTLTSWPCSGGRTTLVPIRSPLPGISVRCPRVFQVRTDDLPSLTIGRRRFKRRRPI